MNIKTLFQSFLNNYNNKFVEVYDASISGKNQCVDLCLQWLINLGHKELIPLGIQNAYQIFDLQKLKPLFTQIKYSPGIIPIDGDIVIWDKAYNGGPGHVGIATEVGDKDSFLCFAQNDPLKSNSHIRRYSYKHILGFLRYITNLPDTPMPTPQLPQELNNYRIDWKEIAVNKGLDVNSSLFQPYRAIDQVLSSELSKQSQVATSKINELEDRLGEVENQNRLLTVANETVQKLYDEQRVKLSECETKCQEGKYNNLIQAISDIVKKVQEVMSDVIKQIKKK